MYTALKLKQKVRHAFRIVLFSFLGLVWFAPSGWAQGCSDAGFCTAGSLKPTGENTIRSSVGIALGYALGEQGTRIITPQLEPQIKVSGKSYIQIQIPVVLVNGKAGNTRGPGDVVASFNYLTDTQSLKPVSILAGLRIATGTSSQKHNNIALPMPYQSSLGTTDLILGISKKLNKGFSVSVAIQQPLVHRNQNGFDSLAFKTLGYPDNENYFISSNLKRKGDAMIRVDKSFKKNKSGYTIGLLPIFHLGEDEIELKGGVSSKVKGSGGLTLNLNGSWKYSLSAKSELNLLAGIPLLVRESRPDGLTRALVVRFGYQYFL